MVPGGPPGEGTLPGGCEASWARGRHQEMALGSPGSTVWPPAAPWARLALWHSPRAFPLLLVPLPPPPAPPHRCALTLGSALCAPFVTWASRWVLSISRTGHHWWCDSVGPRVSWQEASGSGLWLGEGLVSLSLSPPSEAFPDHPDKGPVSPCQHQVSTESTMTPKQGQSLGLSAGSVPGGVEEGNSHTTHAGARSRFDGVGQ